MKLSNPVSKEKLNLIRELVRADFKITDRTTILGIVWSLVGPIAMLLVMYFVFCGIFKQNIKAYPLYLLIGIACVNFFLTTTTYLLKIFSVNREMVLNSMVPSEVLVLSKVLVLSDKFFIELLLCVALSVFYGLFSLKHMLLLLPLIIGYFAFIFGVGLILAIVFCFIMDIEHVWMIISRFLMFATPIFYSLNQLSPAAQKILYWGNPLSSFLISFRQILMYEGAINLMNYSYSILSGVISFILGYFIFYSLKHSAFERI